MSPQAPPAVRRAVLEAHGHQCHYCGQVAAEVDHIVPVCAGGKHNPENLIASCRRCNRAKRGTLLADAALAKALSAAESVAVAVSAYMPRLNRRGRPALSGGDASRCQITLPNSLWDAVSEYRFTEHIPSEAEAVRRLLQSGLKAEKRGAPLFGGQKGRRK